MSLTNPSGSGLETILGTAAAVAQPVRIERGTTIGRYVVIDKLGVGAMGTVFAAFDPELDRKIAIKLLHPRSDEDAAALRREAQTLAKLSHPNVVTVHDVGTFGEQLFLAMEFIDGTTLRAWCEASPRTPAEMLHALVQAGSGLAAAHQAGIVHRDFKPDNVLVCPGAADRLRVCVADFGVAAHEHVGVTELDPARTKDRDADARPGHVVGTPAYMAPEQLRGEAVDPRADQYSFCIAAFEALAGVRPFHGDSTLERAVSARTEVRRDTPRVVPSRALRVLLRGLEHDPAHRWHDMDALLLALRTTSGHRRRTWALVGGAGVVAATSFALARWTSAEEPCAAADDVASITWSPEVRARMQDAFAANATSFAPLAFERVAGALDRWAGEWGEQRRDACEATRVRGEQSERQLELRMACLDRQHHRVGAMIEVLGTGDLDVVERAATIVAALPDAAECRDVTRLDRGPPLPTDPTIVAEVESIRDQLGRVDALTFAGRTQQAMPLALDALARAEATGSEPTLAAARLAVGDAYYGKAEYAEAEQHTRKAFESALAIESDSLAFRAATSMIAMQRYLRRWDEGRHWAGLAMALARRIGGDPQFEATIENNLALLALDSGRTEEATAHAERSLELRLQLDSDDPRIGDAWLNVSATHRMAEQNERGSEAADRAIDVYERSLGSDHPRTLAALNAVAINEFDRGRPDLPIKRMQRVVERRARWMEPDHPSMIDAQATLAAMLMFADRNDEARAMFVRALEIAEAATPPRIEPIIRAETNLAVLELRRGNLELAADISRRATERIGEGMDAHMGIAWAVRGDIAIERGRYEDARASLRRAIDSMSELSDSHPLLLAARAGLALAEHRLGHPIAARAAIDEILRALESTEALGRGRAEILFYAARVLVDSDPARARAIAEEVRAEHERLGDRVMRERIEQWLAEP